jgi:hypothetical protein
VNTFYTPQKALDLADANPDAEFFNVVFFDGYIVNLYPGEFRHWMHSCSDDEIITSIVVWR